MSNTYYIYILTNKKGEVLYTGVTNNLERRIFEHKKGLIDGFTSKYKTNRLIYYEETDNISVAIEREKRIKKWNRQWKIDLIEKSNPNWEEMQLR